jgi:hypothetical protein
MGSSVMGRFESSPIDTTDDLQGTKSNMSPGLGSGQAADMLTTNEAVALTARLAEAMTVVHVLQQQNKELGAANEHSKCGICGRKCRRSELRCKDF